MRCHVAFLQPQFALAALCDMTQVKFLTKTFVILFRNSSALFALATLGDTTLIEITYFYVASHNVAKGKEGYRIAAWNHRRFHQKALPL